MLQLLLSLFPGITSLHQLTSSSRTRIEKPWTKTLVPDLRFHQSYSWPTWCFILHPSRLVPSTYTLLRVCFDFLLPFSPKSNHHHPLLLPSKYIFCFIYFLGPCDRVERTWDVCSKDFYSNTGLSTCWPCGIECFLPLLLPPPPSLPSILSFTTWTAWTSTWNPPARAACTLPASLLTLSTQARCSQLPTIFNLELVSAPTRSIRSSGPERKSDQN